jgi:hypothetical protein
MGIRKKLVSSTRNLLPEHAFHPMLLIVITSPCNNARWPSSKDKLYEHEHRQGKKVLNAPFAGFTAGLCIIDRNSKLKFPDKKLVFYLCLPENFDTDEIIDV